MCSSDLATSSEAPPNTYQPRANRVRRSEVPRSTHIRYIASSTDSGNTSWGVQPEQLTDLTSGSNQELVKGTISRWRMQARLLRLQFTDQALVVWRGATEIRRFPYGEWLGWRLFWPALPALFYFREQRSIHLLPVLFDPKALQEQLNRHVPNPAPPEAP